MLDLTSGSLPPLSLDLSIVVPVFRSEDCLNELVSELMAELRRTNWTYEIILVNDFSPDSSWQQIESLCKKNPSVVGVDLRRNFGQDNAILTGIRLTRGRYVAVMDDDLQHHPKFLPAMVDRAEQGFDVVFADFKHKHHATWKNVGSWINGKIAEFVLYKPKGLYLSPYKVIRREVAEVLCGYRGFSPYIDGLLLQATWRMATIPVEHQPRFSGRGNYGFWRSLGVSARLIFSFSLAPIRFVGWVGTITASLSLLTGAYFMILKLNGAEQFPLEMQWWVFLMIAVFFLGGLQMFFFGVLGEYLGRTYFRVNDRVQTSVREVLNRNLQQSLDLEPRSAWENRFHDSSL